jgi:hypothetical protein
VRDTCTNEGLATWIAATGRSALDFEDAWLAWLQ